MSTSNNSRSPLDFDGLSGTGEYYAAAVPKRFPETDPDYWTNFVPANTIPEEQQHFLTAFHANPKTAAAWRMQLYLKNIGSASVGGALSDNKREARREEKHNNNRFAFTFYFLSEHAGSSPSLAATALDRTAEQYSRHRQNLAALIEEAQAEFARLAEEITGKRSDVSARQTQLADIKIRIATADQLLAESDLQADALETQYMEAGGAAIALENRAIKIVRSFDSIADYKRAMTEPETEAPDIYIVSGSAADGTIIYDRIRMDSAGQLRIDQIHEDDVPALRKEPGMMVSDMIERVYYRGDEHGHTHFVRMEHGINGELMGAIGGISNNMLAQYLARTGQSAADLTIGAAEYEARMHAHNTLLDTHGALYERRKSLRGQFTDNLEELRHIETLLLSDRENLLALEDRAHHYNETIGMLKKECNHVEQMMALSAKYKDRLHSGEFCSLEDMTCEMPDELKRQFLKDLFSLHRAHEIHRESSGPCQVGEKGPNCMNAAWSRVTPQSRITNDIGTPSQPVFYPRPAENLPAPA